MRAYSPERIQTIPDTRSPLESRKWNWDYNNRELADPKRVFDMDAEEIAYLQMQSREPGTQNMLRLCLEARKLADSLHTNCIYPEQIVDLYWRGLPMHFIANIFGVDLDQVEEICLEGRYIHVPNAPESDKIEDAKGEAVCAHTPEGGSVTLYDPGSETTYSYEPKYIETLHELMYVWGLRFHEIVREMNTDSTQLYALIRHLESTGKIKWNRNDRRWFMRANLEFLETPSEDLAYFLGLMATDGSVHKVKKKSGVSFITKISLTQKPDTGEGNEETVLRRLAGKIGSYITKKGNVITLCVQQREFTEKLMELGIEPRKTFTTCIPDCVKKYYYPAFFAGVIDGDGCLYIGKSRSRNRNKNEKMRDGSEGSECSKGSELDMLSLSIRIVSANRSFLEEIAELNKNIFGTTRVTIDSERRHNPETGTTTTYYRLIYGYGDTAKILQGMQRRGLHRLSMERKIQKGIEQLLSYEAVMRIPLYPYSEPREAAIRAAYREAGYRRAQLLEEHKKAARRSSRSMKGTNRGAIASRL